MSGAAIERAEGTASAAGGEDTDALGMFYRMSAERLRARCLWAGLALLATVLVPFEIIGGAGLFLWSVFAELEAAAKIAALAPAAAGLFLILLSLRTKDRGGLVIERPTSRAIAVLAGFIAVNGAMWIGARSSAWGLLPLPDSLTTRPAPFLAVFALTAAGAVLRFHPRARKAGGVLLVASMGAAVLFYLWPSRTEIPAATIARAILSVVTLADLRFQIGYGMILLFLLGPLVIAVLGLAHVRDVPKREHPAVAILAVWGVPALMLLFVYRAFIAGGVGVQVIITAFFAALLLTTVSVLASAIEVLALGVVTPEAEAPWSGARPAVAGGIALGALAAFFAGMLAAGKPAPKGVDWKLAAPTPEWDRVLGELLPSWERARLARDSHARAETGTGAEAQVATRARSREMLAAAKARPEGKDLAAALETLAREVDDLELSGRAFGRLVADVNDAARRSELPYYLDASVHIGVSESGARRIFYVTPYRVKEVHGFRVGQDRFATLVVEPMTGERRVHLGFSRDQDPFALVLESETRSYAERMNEPSPRCLRTPVEGEAASVLARCDAAMGELRRRVGDGMAQAVFKATERHELQHQIDGPHLPLSSAVAELLAGYTDEAQDRANRELSAYVAEMTTPDAPPQLTLVHLFPFGAMARGGAEHRVAVLLLETLAGEKLRFGARAVDPDTFARAFEEQMSRPDDDLRAAARAAYRSHFGVDLQEPVRE